VDNGKIDYRILGSFEVWVGDRLVGLGGEKPRALLAILLLHHGEVVSADRLIDDLWGESPPDSALRTVQAYVSRLRKALGPNGASGAEGPESAFPANGGVLLTRGRGYLLEVAPGELDLERFRDLVESGRDALAAGKPGEAAGVLREALGMWRGPPLAEFVYEPFAQGVIAQLEELYLAAVEDRVQADLALGGGGRAARPGRSPPAARAGAWPADSGAVPHGEAGRGAGGLPSVPAQSVRGARP
jgi:DNA-binding SARP family transcriptional activator